ncbi:MAG TPA: glycosyltransferase [Solirubrobacteraceae bacterium]|jgi:glycosyltransferase involved in cell wall biosynthesis
MAREVTVVIPTHGRPEGLARAVDALRAQTLAADRFDVVVVDDGSEPPARVDATGLALRVLRHERSRGPAAARNTGWRAASSPLIAFTDDDCTPAPGWLAALLAACGGDRVVVQGRVEPRPDQRDRLGPLSHTLQIGDANRLFMTANIAYPRALLDALGGFDEWFTRACGEDVELGARATKAGAEVRFAGDALVHHDVRPMRLAQHLRHTVKWADSVRTLSLHPEMRDLLTARVFWKPSHPKLLLAAAGLAARRPLLTLPYLAHLRRLYGGDVAAAARAAPAHVAIDVTEVVTMVVASARYRTLML